MVLSYVYRTGNPAAAWNYITKAATMGRSYLLYAANVAWLASLGILGRSDSPGCRAIRQSWGLVDSRQPLSISGPCLLRTMTASRVKATVQSASHRVTTTIKVWRKPGIRFPFVGNSDGRWVIGKTISDFWLSNLLNGKGPSFLSVYLLTEYAKY